MSRFFTPALAALEPYTPGEQIARPDLVKLNANENPYPPAPGVAAAVADTVAGLRLYSDLRQTKLVSAIAALRRARRLGALRQRQRRKPAARDPGVLR